VSISWLRSYGLNIGARHIIRRYPFLAVLIGVPSFSSWREKRLLAFRHNSCCSVAFFWSARGLRRIIWRLQRIVRAGPRQHHILTDANTDGEHRLVSAEYPRRHKIHDCWLGYFVQPSRLSPYGILCRQHADAKQYVTEQQVDVPATSRYRSLVNAVPDGERVPGSVILSPFRSPSMNVRPGHQLTGVVCVRCTRYVASAAFDTSRGATKALRQTTRRGSARSEQQLPSIPILMQGNRPWETRSLPSLDH